MTHSHPFPPAQKHGDIEPVFDNIYMVTGTFAMTKPMPMAFSRNMIIVRHGRELTLINSVRLTEAGLSQLDALGEVKHVIRLAAFHGADDPFYQRHYQAKIWSVNAPYVRGVTTKPTAEDIYFTPDIILDASTQLPIPNATYLSITSAKPNEGLLFLHDNDGVMISGDCLQNWSKSDEYFSFLAKIMMKWMGFIKPHNVGPAWFKGTHAKADDVRKILNFNFQHLLPAHGKAVINNARALYKENLIKLS